VYKPSVHVRGSFAIDKAVRVAGVGVLAMVLKEALAGFLSLGVLLSRDRHLGSNYPKGNTTVLFPTKTKSDLTVSLSLKDQVV